MLGIVPAQQGLHAVERKVGIYQVQVLFYIVSGVPGKVYSLWCGGKAIPIGIQPGGQYGGFAKIVEQGSVGQQGSLIETLQFVQRVLVRLGQGIMAEAEIQVFTRMLSFYFSGCPLDALYTYIIEGGG